jgi:DnaK suppressor protein
MVSPAATEPAATELAAKRAELEEALGRLAAPSTDEGGISFGKRVGDGTSIAVERLSQVAAHDRLQTMYADVCRAQSKLDDGTYGVCDGCGAAIPDDRLQALPWAVRCMACAAQGPARS